MKKLKIFILVSSITFFLVLIVKAFENPTQNPPLGGGALQIQSNQLLITKPTKVTGTNTFIVEGGNVGIGTTAPNYNLDVRGDTNIRNNNHYFGYTQSYTPNANQWAKIAELTLPNYWRTINGVITIAGSKTYTPSVPGKTEIFVAVGTNSDSAQTPRISWIKWGNHNIQNVRLVQTTNSLPYKYEIWINNALIQEGEFSIYGQFDGRSEENITWFKNLTWQSTAPTGIAYWDGTLIARIDTNVGIGTTAPADKLHISGGHIRLENNNALRWFANTDGANVRFESTGDGSGASKLIIETVDNANEPIEFRQSGNVRMVISNLGPGNIGIGTTAPVSKLDVNGNIQISNAAIPMGLMTEVGGTTPLLNFSVNFREPNKNTAYRGAAFRIDTRDGYPLFQWLTRAAGSTSESVRMVLTEAGNVGIGTTAPSAKLDVDGGVEFGDPLETSNPSNRFRFCGSGTNPATCSTASELIAGKIRLSADGSFANAEGQADPGMGGIHAPGTVLIGGKVGIGTTAPTSPLQVVTNVNGGSNTINLRNLSTGTSASNWLQFGNDTTNDAFVVGIRGSNFSSQGNHAFVWNRKNASLHFGTNNTYRMTIDSVGNVGIGTTAPGYKLDVAGSVHASSFPVSSDIRFKKNIESLTVSGSVLEKLNNLQGVYFEWNDVYKNLGRGDDKRHIGLIAQEVEKEFPELVSQWGDGSDYRAVDYSRFTAVLLEGLKELNQKLEEFKNKIENGILYVKEIFTHRVTTKEIQLIDKSTNEIYCVWLENGEFQKSKGECR